MKKFEVQKQRIFNELHEHCLCGAINDKPFRNKIDNLMPSVRKLRWNINQDHEHFNKFYYIQFNSESEKWELSAIREEYILLNEFPTLTEAKSYGQQHFEKFILGYIE